jgi:hypothetical protein
MDTMDVISCNVCGLDVHKKTVVAGRRRVGSGGQGATEVKTLGTTTAALLSRVAWMGAWQVSHGAMESTGVEVRRITARALSLAEGTGSEGNLWGNDSLSDASHRGQQQVVEAERPRSRVWSGSARPVCSGESVVACPPVPRDGTGHPSLTTADATLAGEGRPRDAT